MHDNSILVFEIPGLWKVRGYRPTLFSVWHDGDCGWAYPEITKQEWEKISQVMECATDFFQKRGNYYVSIMAQLETTYGMAETIAWRLWHKQLKPKHLMRLMSLVSDPVDNIRHYFENPLEYSDLERLYWIITRVLKRIDRPWYKHPRWHLHHWCVHCDWLVRFKRWVFSRCCVCGKRFRYGEAPISKGNGDGPRWFKSEENVYHCNCGPNVVES